MLSGHVMLKPDFFPQVAAGLPEPGFLFFFTSYQKVTKH